MSIKASFNHLELVPGVILYVAFAKVVENVPLPSLALKPAASLGLMPLAHQANEPSDGRRKSPPKSVDMLATDGVRLKPWLYRMQRAEQFITAAICEYRHDLRMRLPQYLRDGYKGLGAHSVFPSGSGIADSGMKWVGGKCVVKFAHGQESDGIPMW